MPRDKYQWRLPGVRSCEVWAGALWSVPVPMPTVAVRPGNESARYACDKRQVSAGVEHGEMRALLDLLIPPACAGCGDAGSVLCVRCRRDLRPTADPAYRFVAADASLVIGGPLTLGVGAFAYEGRLRNALGRLKYAGVARVAGELAGEAMPALRRLLAITGPVSLVPVPVHIARERQRGYNQAALLARHLADRGAGPVAHVLARAHLTERQHRLDRAGRLRNLRTAISLDGRKTRVPEVALIVDDILTTAATMEACAGVLLAAGTREAYGFAIAREV